MNKDFDGLSWWLDIHPNMKKDFTKLWSGEKDSIDSRDGNHQLIAMRVENLFFVRMIYHFNHATHKFLGHWSYSDTEAPQSIHSIRAFKQEFLDNMDIEIST